MILKQEQIKKMSEKLWKVNLEDAKLSQDLENILKYAELLNEVDTTWVEPTISVVEEENLLRNDEIWKNKVSPKDLLDCSNQKIIADQIAISNIMS